MDIFGVDLGGGKRDVTPARQVLHEAIVQLVSERQISSLRGNEHDDKIFLFSKNSLKTHPQFQKLQAEGSPDRAQISAILDDLNVPRLNLVSKAEQVMMITGGPGTGKSGLHENFQTQSPDIYNNAAQINPDHYKDILADRANIGAIHGTYTHYESSMIADKIMDRVSEKIQAGKPVPHVLIDVATTWPNRVEFSNQFDHLSVLTGTAPPHVTVERAYIRGIDRETLELKGRVTPTYATLDGAKKASELMPHIFTEQRINDGTLNFSLVNTDVPKGAKATPVAEWNPKIKSLNVTDHNRFIDFVERQNINPTAESRAELFQNADGTKISRSPATVAKTMQPYLDKGITINFMTPDNQVAMAISKDAIKTQQPMVSNRTKDERYFDGIAHAAAKENGVQVTGSRVTTIQAERIQHRAGSGVGVGMGVYGLSQKLGENGTAAGDLRDDRTRNLAKAGIATDMAAIGVDGAEGLATLSKVSKGLESASRVSRVAAPVAAGLAVASGVVEYKIAEKKGDGKRAAEAVGSTAGGLTGALAGGVAGAKGGALAGAAIGAFFGGVGAAPGAAIGGFIGGLAGAIGGGWAGAEGGKAVSREVLTDTFQKQFDEQRPVKKTEITRPVREASNQPYYDYSPSSSVPSPAKSFAASAPDMGQHFRMASTGIDMAANEAKMDFGVKENMMLQAHRQLNVSGLAR